MYLVCAAGEKSKIFVVVIQSQLLGLKQSDVGLRLLPSVAVALVCCRLLDSLLMVPCLASSSVLMLKATACPLWVPVKTVEGAYMVFDSDGAASPSERDGATSDLLGKGRSGKVNVPVRLPFAFSFLVRARRF